jgi:hypothetical protein
LNAEWEKMNYENRFHPIPRLVANRLRIRCEFVANRLRIRATSGTLRGGARVLFAPNAVSSLPAGTAFPAIGIEKGITCVLVTLRVTLFRLRSERSA